MKRIDRLTVCVRHEAMMALVFFFAAFAAGAWAMMAALSGGMLGGTALGVAAIIALLLSAAHLRECLRVSRLAFREMEWEVRHD
jgi:ABC-type transport system involved in cytochrome bd biosynthesis fused ATPase/permease subunit